MSEASFASLGPTLLARKGGAKPAMRPQVGPLPEVVGEEELEDLGWNDMGQDDGPDVEVSEKSADIVSIKPKAKKADAAPKAANEDVAETVTCDEQAEPIERVQAKKPTKTAKAKTAATAKSAPRKSGAANQRRAAFTLRLDTDRHLKLRLAATMQDKSAQALVTEALDAMLAKIDDLDALASRMKRT